MNEEICASRRESLAFVTRQAPMEIHGIDEGELAARLCEEDKQKPGEKPRHRSLDDVWAMLDRHDKALRLMCTPTSPVGKALDGIS